METQGAAQKTTIVRSGLRRPNWICWNARQIVVLVRDKSGSMSGQKAQDASAASLDLVAELAQPVNKDGFLVGVVDFASRSQIVHDLARATELDGRVTPLSVGGGLLSLFGGGSTNITVGLEDAKGLLDKAERVGAEGVQYLRPVAILFSDGCHNTGPGPKDVADRLKQEADLVTVAFGSDADEALLRSLASSHQHFYRCANGRELRSFLAAVGATMTATMAAGTNATQALTTIR
jgi:uncharacterized protein YegL